MESKADFWNKKIEYLHNIGQMKYTDIDTKQLSLKNKIQQRRQKPSLLDFIYRA
jgi:hypothetical protein